MEEYTHENWTPQPQPDSACVEIMGDIHGERVVVARAYGYTPLRVGPQPSKRDHCARLEWTKRHKVARTHAVAEARGRANIMAAGPDLLDKLELMVGYAIDLIGREPIATSVGADILKGVRATIAKARCKAQPTGGRGEEET